MVDCKRCKKRFKADEIDGQKCSECGGELTEARPFNMMFKTYIGPVEDSAAQTYLRPETAQGIFVNFKNVLDSIHKKLPFGIAQIGKAFRNEVTPGNFIFRCREFEQMELEYFIKPEEDEKWFNYWTEQRYRWFLNLGIKEKNLKIVKIAKKDLAHYSKATSELHYRWPFISKNEGFGELEGIANRTDYDLKNHQEFSKQDLLYFDEENKRRYFPYIIEPSLGVDRAFLAFLIDAYNEEEERIVLKIHPKLAPYKVAVFPLLANKPQLIRKAYEVYQLLKPYFMTAWDDRGNIGKRYKSQDEIGTPWCITIDFETLENNTVTLRARDTMKQERISIEEIINKIQ